MTREEMLERISELYLQVPFPVVAKYMSTEEASELVQLYRKSEKSTPEGKYWAGRTK